MTDKLALEKAIDFIESLTRDPLLLPDDIEMTLDDVQAHARIELASIRKVLDASPPAQMPGNLPDEKPDAPVENRPEWIWYCESTSGVPVVTFGRWPKHPQQARYKLAEIQPTEHDHPTPPAHLQGKNRAQGMVRSIDQWRGMDPKTVLSGSEAQTLYALQDAQHDILAMWSVLSSIAAEGQP